MLKVQSKIEESTNCVICMEPCKSVPITCKDCGNILCQQCKTQYSRYSKKCPICRARRFKGFKNKKLHNSLKNTEKFIDQNRGALQLLEDCETLFESISSMDMDDSDIKATFLTQIVKIKQKISDIQSSGTKEKRELMGLCEEVHQVQEAMRLVRDSMDRNFEDSMEKVLEYMDAKIEAAKASVEAPELNQEDNYKKGLTYSAFYFGIFFGGIIAVMIYVYILYVFASVTFKNFYALGNLLFGGQKVA